MNEQTSRRIKRREHGLCIECGQPAFIHLHGKRQGQASNMCAKHMAQRLAIKRASRQPAKLRRNAPYLSEAPATPAPALPGTPSERTLRQRHRRQPKGICTQCGAPAVRYEHGPKKGRMTSRCHDHRDYKKQKRQARRSQGLCIVCGQPAARHEGGPRHGQFFPHCLPHLIQVSEYMRQRAGTTRLVNSSSYRAQRAAGLPVPDLPPPSQFAGLSSQHAKERRAQHLCIHCGQPAFIHPHGQWKGKVSDLCLTHLGQRREIYRAAHGSIKRNRSASYAADPDGPQPFAGRAGRKWPELRAAGLCVLCGKPAQVHPSGRRQGQPTIYCPEHAARKSEYYRQRAAKREPNSAPSLDANNPLTPPTEGAPRTHAEICRQRYHESLQQGRCTRCGEPAFRFPDGPRQGHLSIYCRKHLDHQKKRWQQLLDKGICLTCGQPAARHEAGQRAGKAFPYCIEHLIQAREKGRQRAGSISRKNAPSYRAQQAAGLPMPELPVRSLGPDGKPIYQKKRRESGLCQHCAQPSLLHLWGKRKGQPSMLCLHHARLLKQERDVKNPARRQRYILLAAHEQAILGHVPQGPLNKEVRRRRQGLCCQCGQPALLYPSGKKQGQPASLCLQHLVERREARRLISGSTRRSPSLSYEAEIAAGLASPYRLPKPQQNKSNGERLRELRQQGLCVKCKQPALIHLWGKRKGKPAGHCAKHLAERRERIRQLYGCIGRVKSLSYLSDPSIPTPNSWREGRTPEDLRRAGLCRICGQPTQVHLSGKQEGQHYILCVQHNEASLLYGKHRLAQLRAQEDPAYQPSAATTVTPVPPPPGILSDSRRAQGLCWVCKQPADIHLTGLKKGQPYIYCSKHRAIKNIASHNPKQASEPTP